MRQFIALLIVIIICLNFGNTANFVGAQTGTPVEGIIQSDTTWTKANSPYILVGPVGISKGVTLTIEVGVTVNGGYLQVNGSLVARGTPDNPIIVNQTRIEFTPLSNGWNEQTNSGSIIENTEITSNAYNCIYINQTDPKIASNTIVGNLFVNSASPVISHNSVMGSITVEDGAPEILDNTIVTTVYGIECSGGFPNIIGNTVTTQNNGSGFGIFGGKGYIASNIVSGFETGIRAGYTIQGNLIVNNYYGIKVEYDQTIQNNTIVNSFKGLLVGESISTIQFNNFQDNEYNLYLDLYANRNITATNNWWGTTDSALIAQKAHYTYNDFDLIAVDFIPFLIAPNPKAPAIPKDTEQTTTPSTSPTPTQNPLQPLNPTATAQQPETQAGVLFGLDWKSIAIIALGLLVAVLLALLALRGKHRK